MILKGLERITHFCGAPCFPRDDKEDTVTQDSTRRGHQYIISQKFYLWLSAVNDILIERNCWRCCEWVGCARLKLKE